MYLGKPRTRQEMYCKYKRKLKARSRKNFCREQEISITYSECVTVILVIQHAKRMRRIHCHLLTLFVSTIFFHTIS